MKKPQSGIMGLSVVAALFLAVAGTLPLAAQDIPASSVMPPGYLQAMPAADRVLSDMKVADSVETRARRIAAVSYLRDILSVLTWDHLYVQGGRSGLTPKEDSLNRGYLDAWNRLFYLSGTVPGLTALINRYSAESSPLRSEILDRYFSPAWKAALMALDARYRVVENAPPTVQAEQRTRDFANLRCTPGATGAHRKPVSGLEKEACDMATAEIGKHWAKQPDGWTSVLSEGTDFAPIVFIRQVRSLAVERVETHELSAADKMNGFEWAGEVWFSKEPAREMGVQGFTLGMAGTIVRPGQWSQWVDYQPPPLRVQRVKGKWEVHPDNSLLEGKVAGVIASQQLEQANAPGRDTRLAVRPAPCEEVCGFISVNVTGAPARPNGRPAKAPMVWIDGVTVGRTPVVNYKIKAGQHTIVTHSGHLYVNETVQVDSGATVVKSYDATPR